MAFAVPEDELTIRATRARGPGGQHVNKASTRIEVVWSVAESPSLSATQRERLRVALASRLDSSERLRIACDEHRSQARNRRTAIARLRETVREGLRVPKKRKPTKPPAASKARRLDEKRRQGQKKRLRKPVRGDPDE